MRSKLLSLALTAALAFVPAAALAEPIVIDADQRHQTIEGFGTSLINFGVQREIYPPLYRTEAFQRFYVQEMGMNMMRCNLWGGVLVEPVEDWRDIRFQDFDLAVTGVTLEKEKRDMAVFVDFAKGMLALNPDAKIIGTVWTPPAWMKVNNSLTDEAAGAILASGYTHRRTGEPLDNRLKPDHFHHYAKYLLEWVKLFEHETGKPLYALSIGNEVQFTQPFGSCVWTAEDYGNMIVILGEMLEEAGYGDVKIYGPETMTSHTYEGGTHAYVKELMEGPAAQYLDVFATHGYVDGVQAEFDATPLAEFRRLIEPTGKPFWITEGGTGGHNWPEPLTGIAAAIHNSLVHGNVEAFVSWQITDPRANTHGMMVWDQPTPKTYAAQHFTHFIDSGAVRLEASPAEGEVRASAYLYPETGNLTVVLINPHDEERAVELELKGDAGNGNSLPMQLKAYRTSEHERMRPLEDVVFEDGQISITMPPLSIITFDAEGKGR